MNPFLGARPYGPSEDRLFFGRTVAASRLAEQIDLRPVTILTSSSGLGKTSLLRAAVIPQLETSGLSAIYMRADPLVDIQRGSDAAASLLDGRLAAVIIENLIPDPALEIEAIRLASQAAPPALLLGETHDWFETSDVREQLLTSKVGAVDTLSLFARYLRGSVSLTALANQASLVGAEDVAALFVPSTPLKELFNKLHVPQYVAKLEAARRMLKPPEPPDARLEAQRPEADDLRVIMDLLSKLGSADQDARLVARPDGDVNLNVRVVLIIDQFEQLFTLCGTDRRRQAFALLAGLINAKASLHIVIALRKEWYADLVQQFATQLRTQESLARLTFHLEPMTFKEANEVMERAPLVVKAPSFSPSQRLAIWNYLQIDGGIDAVVLSIACHEYFASSIDGNAEFGAARIEQLFGSYLERALSALETEAGKEEAIDVLGEIAGTSATREFVTTNRLLDAPLRDRAFRGYVLSLLQKAFLVKADNLGQGREKVYDIMHERLLAPVRALVEGWPTIPLFREAARAVSQHDAVELGLSWHHCRTLLTSSRRIAWDSRSAGVLLASMLRELTADRINELQAIVDPNGVATEAAGIPAWLRSRLREAAEACASSTESATVSSEERLRTSWWMTPREIRTCLEGPWDSTAEELALRSCIQCPAGLMRDELALLVERVNRNAAENSMREGNP